MFSEEFEFFSISFSSMVILVVSYGIMLGNAASVSSVDGLDVGTCNTSLWVESINSSITSKSYGENIYFDFKDHSNKLII